jgi:spoIIIJ-associated protein
MTFREFTGKNVEEAIRGAMKEYGADLSDLDIEILSQGSRGILGVGSEDARILAAPKSAVAEATSVRDMPAARPPDAVDASEAASHADTDAAVPQDDLSAGVAAEGSETPRRSRGGRGRGRNGRERSDRERNGRAGSGERSARSTRPPREPREPRESREPAPFIPAKPLEELSDEQRHMLEQAKAVLEELLRLMDLDATVEITLGAETAKLNVKGGELGALIGRRGEKLASLQHIVNLIVAKREGQWARVAVDVENYRGRREEQLREVAERAAKRVVQTGKIIQLEAMPAVERRVVHMILAENPKIRTQSVGVEPNRRIVILPAAKVEA